jgi:DHA2 family multidrug resistance protein-like MFS transporter
LSLEGLGWVSALSIIAGAFLGSRLFDGRGSSPEFFMDLRLFRIPFSVSLALYGVGIFVVFGGFLFLPQYLQRMLGLSTLEAGLGPCLGRWGS